MYRTKESMKKYYNSYRYIENKNKKSIQCNDIINDEVRTFLLRGIIRLNTCCSN